MLKKKTLLKSNINGFDRKNEKTRKKLSKFEIRTLLMAGTFCKEN